MNASGGRDAEANVRQPERWRSAALAGVALAATFALGLAHLRPDRSWAFGFAPATLGWILLGTATVTALDPFNRWVLAGIAWIGHRLYGLRRSVRAAVYLLLAGGSAFVFLRFHSRNHLGDGSFLMDIIARGYRVDPHAPLGKLLQHDFYAWSHLRFGLDIRESWALTSAVYGSIFVLAVLLLAEILTCDRTHRILLVGMCMALGSVQLFFGYVEDYPGSYLFLGLFILAAVCTLRGRLDIFWPGLVFGTGVTLSMSLGPLFPALFVLVATACSRTEGVLARALVLLRTGVAVLLPITALVLFFRWEIHLNLKRFVLATHVARGTEHFVPWTGDGGLLSGGHLLDVLRLQALVAPFSLVLCVTIVVLFRRHLDAGDPVLRFALLLALSAFGFYFFWVPGLGMPGDWDLFSISGLPLTLLAFVMVDSASHVCRERRWWIPVLAVSAVRTAAWVLANHRGPWA